MPRIVDAFVFYNEVDMLWLRLNEMGPVVDIFVLVEATRTFAGAEKASVFETVVKADARFRPWLDRIVHVVVDDMPVGAGISAWTREAHQRNAIRRGLERLGLATDDVVVIADVDEIVDARVLGAIKSGEAVLPVDPVAIPMDMYYYNLTCRLKEVWWKAFVCRWGSLPADLDGTRLRAAKPRLSQKAGWHLSYFGDVAFIANKIRHFSHQEFNNAAYTDARVIEEAVRKGRSLFTGEEFEYVPLDKNTYLPRKWALMVRPEEANRDLER